MKFDLQELQSLPLPRMRSDGAVRSETRVDVPAGYFEHFLAPRALAGKLLCVGCGSELAGLFGAFTWSLAHGEGYCSGCGYPGRALHYFPAAGGDRCLDFILQYHPDEIVTPQAVSA